MHNIELILTITGGLSFALILGYITHRLGLSPIVGYLLAGIVVSPFTPGFVANREMAEQLAEIGVILLMFGVGLHFSFKELLAVRRIAIPGAIVQSLVATLLGATLGWWLGWGLTAGFVFGMAISVASTVVLIRVLADNNDLHTPTGHIAVGWLVVEDLFTVILLVILPALASGHAPASEQATTTVAATLQAVEHATTATSHGFASIMISLGIAMVKICILVAFTFLVGGRVIPWLLEHVAATRSRELFTLTVLVVALGIAVGATKLFGVSMALGAFLAGMVVGRSDFSVRAASDALPMRDAFAVLFFVSVGMLFDPHFLLEEPGTMAMTLAIVMIGKPVAALIITLVLGYPLRTAITVAVVLGQVGEFSFMLGGLAKTLGLLSDGPNNAIIAAAIVSISVNPLLYHFITPLEKWAMRRPKLWAILNGPVRKTTDSDDHDSGELSRDSQHHAVVIGYGPVGQTVTRLLRENDIDVTVIELNMNTVKQLKEKKIKVVYGDATHSETLVQAGIEKARHLILSASGIADSAEVIKLAKDLNPDIHVAARTAYLREIPELRNAGAMAAYSGEGEVAITMATEILHSLGASPEQIDRERARVHKELIEGTVAVPAAAH